MKISAKTDYACRAILELAIHWPNQTPLQLNEIARRQQIPIKFLTQIFVSLKQVGLVLSVRGKSGGYTLARPPAEITIWMLINHFEPLVLTHTRKKSCALNRFWEASQKKFQSVLEGENFERLAQEQKAINGVPNFVI